jgi:outer membrane protein assembly factor BamB
MYCLDTQGHFQWKTPFGAAYTKSFPESRTTPTVDGDKVYAVSGGGIIACLNTKDGKILWSVDAFETYKGKIGIWGTAESALIDNRHVYYTACGDETTVVALNKNKGTLAWKSKSINDKSAYVSPILIDHGGRSIVVAVSGDAVVGINAADGRLLWTYDYTLNRPSRGGDINANSPIYYDGAVFVTSGYNHVGVKLRLNDDGSAVEREWMTEDMDTHTGGVVLVDGYLYGTSWDGNNDGNWVCLDWRTGRTMYSTHWECKGSVIYADGMLYCYSEKPGSVGLVKADPKGFNVISQFPVTFGKKQHWAHPAVSDGVLYIRHGRVLGAYDIQQ